MAMQICPYPMGGSGRGLCATPPRAPSCDLHAQCPHLEVSRYPPSSHIPPTHTQAAAEQLSAVRQQFEVAREARALNLNPKRPSKCCVWGSCWSGQCSHVGLIQALSRCSLNVSHNSPLLPLPPSGGDDMKALDSSVKRNTALVKKLRQLTEESASSLMDDIVKTNQSKVRPVASWTTLSRQTRATSCPSRGGAREHA